MLRVPVLSAPFTRSATMRADDANQLILLSSATLPIDFNLQLVELLPKPLVHSPDQASIKITRSSANLAYSM